MKTMTLCQIIIEYREYYQEIIFNSEKNYPDFRIMYKFTQTKVIYL